MDRYRLTHPRPPTPEARSCATLLGAVLPSDQGRQLALPLRRVVARSPRFLERTRSAEGDISGKKLYVSKLRGFRRRANRHENANLGRVDVFAPATSAQAPVSSAGRPSALRPVVSAAPAALHFVRRRSHSLQLRLRGSPPHRCCHSLRLWLRLWLRRLPTTTTKTTTTKNNHQKQPPPPKTTNPT